MSKKKKQRGNTTDNTQEKILPRAFFRRIGVEPFIDPNNQYMYRVVKKKVGKKIADEFYDLAHNKQDYGSAMNLSFSHLELAKLWYGNQLIQASKIAEELATLSISANANILDIGGGPGALAFWMAHIWEDCHVTVADKFPEVGMEWATEIGEVRVTFVNSLLPDLKGLPDQAYDVVVMSRVLRYVGGLDMPRFLNTHNLADYPESEEGCGFFMRFGNLIEKIKRVMTPDGHLVIVDEWNELNVYVTGKAIEQRGLYIDSGFFDYKRLSGEFSAVAFSALKATPDFHSLDLPMGISASFAFPQIPFPLVGTFAESVRKLFGDIKPKAEFERETTGNKIQLKWKYEVLERYGIALIYITNQFCARRALLYPSTAIPEVLETLRKNEIPSIKTDDPSSSS